ncbi:MAG TPA: hypothetical protein PLM79_16740 [Syntrophobacteraceae bacterium]|nr:hypothetical protein [Syntrophobacteraceae bacterium]
MTWTVFRWVWRLEAPLFVGMPPAGALNRCRLYLPARAMHGAITSELARMDGEKKSKFPDYGKFGKEVGENCRFTYLYPAEKLDGKFLAWVPKYLRADHDKKTRDGEQKIGLRWHRMDGKRDFSDRDFRRSLLDSRSGTAIAPESDSASEGTLRETECINPWWRDVSGARTDPKPVLLLGYVFLKNNGFRRQLDNIDTLFVGGDTRYGLGKIHRVELTDLSADISVFGKKVYLDGEEPEMQSNIVWGHALEGSQNQTMKMQGVKELPGRWEIVNLWKRRRENGKEMEEFPAWAPGSCFENTGSQSLEYCWAIDTYGIWEYVPH